MSGDETIRRINDSKADFLLVALGARKGQAWIVRNRERISVPVVSYLGAAINFLAGTVRRAPPAMQRAGLEWLWRIKEEPALWRRYASDGIALARLLTTRVLPLAWHLRRRRPGVAAIGAASIESSIRGDVRVIGIRGAWCSQNIERLRACVAAAASAPERIELDLSGMTFADSAFIGLMLVLRKHRKDVRVTPAANELPAPIRSAFRLSCAAFLLDGHPVDQDVAGKAQVVLPRRATQGRIEDAAARIPGESRTGESRGRVT